MQMGDHVMRKIMSVHAAMLGAAVLIGSNAPAAAERDCQQFLNQVDWYESVLEGVTRHPKEAEYRGRIRVAKERYKACMSANKESPKTRARERAAEEDIETFIGIGGFIGHGSSRGGGKKH